MGDCIDTFYAKYLEGLACEVLKPIQTTGRHTGIIIDWNDGFSRYPQEHKPLSLVAMEQGNFGLLPNNYFKLVDKHFTEELNTNNINLKKYKRGEELYWEQ